MTDDNSAGAGVVGVRFPQHLRAWLEKKRDALLEQGLDASLPMVVKQQIERMKKIDEASEFVTTKTPPKKARKT